MIANKPALLQGIADGLRELARAARKRNPPGDVKLGTLDVVFVTDSGDEYAFGLEQALDALANDTYWNERGNWADATRAEVRVI